MELGKCEKCFKNVTLNLKILIRAYSFNINNNARSLNFSKSCFYLLE